MIDADRQMKGVARAKIELGLVGKARGCAKVFPLHREAPKAFGAQAGECRKRGRTIVCAKAPVRNFIDSAEANSVVVQSLIVSSDVSCVASHT